MIDRTVLFNNNLCQEVMLTGQQQLRCILGSTITYYYPWAKTNAALNRLPMNPYKFSRAKWYEAKLPRDRQDAYSWCVETFGAEPKNPDAWSRWYLNVERTFRFRDEKDYHWFILRWSS